ncbi:hypothetical protein ACJVC5_04270 [Peredibacter sp. HCB2-198]|uniref:hypothetical protein n=1 Tax=Peredibacter sp. HCB2-198 TaxID=3383025 RepID=UPI0038B5A59C
MKSLFTVALLAVSVQAFAGRWFLESHYGKMSVVNGKYACTLTNKTGDDLNLKRVQFSFERRAGKSREVVETKNVHQVLAVGETLTVSSGAGRELIAGSCKFLAR